RFSAWSGTLVTATDLVVYGTLERYMKALDAKTGKELWRFKTPSGIIGNPMTYIGPDGKQYVAILSGVGGWAGIGLAAGLEGDSEGLGAVGAYKKLAEYTTLGGVLTERDRKSTRLNSSHEWISYAVFCLKKKKRICAVQEL